MKEGFKCFYPEKSINEAVDRHMLFERLRDEEGLIFEGISQIIQDISTETNEGSEINYSHILMMWNPPQVDVKQQEKAGKVEEQPQESSLRRLSNKLKQIFVN